ncbi:MAG TPA: hypothetical protein VHM31_16210 [Polyangia bacterium]|nr:hypothetical protein [Polyangia bacterium]
MSAAALNAWLVRACLAAAVLTAAAGSARTAAACAAPGDAAAAPLAGGTTTFNPADFGTVPEVCPAGEASLRVRGELVDASGAPDFFGRLVGSVTLRARRTVTQRTWVALSIDLLDERYVNDAGLAASGASFGPASIGFHWTALARDRGALAVYTRALLPIDTARQSGAEAGLELGAAGRVLLPRQFVLDGGLNLAAPVDFVAGQAHGHLRPAGLAEVWWSRSPRLAVAAGLAATLEAAPDPALLLLIPRVGLRTGLRHRLWLAFLAEAPVAGTDRTNLIASAFLGWAP